MTPTQPANCPLCDYLDDGRLIYRNAQLRVIDAAEPDFPGFTRVVWNTHISEMTDLSDTQRSLLMESVWKVEQVLRQQLRPNKVNVAQLGNQVPHLHWHVIPRWTADSHFPNAIWAAPAQRSPTQTQAWDKLRSEIQERVPAYHDALRQALAEVQHDVAKG